ncbi:MAG: hypothetical protein CM1200mP16_00600 [Nitrospina sp.]|nr:MAG: hypothetical protein CM1200mP16_00600 [Nitrospina sp.]
MGQIPGSTIWGWRMRVELSRILLQSPDVLLLDEPSNHLDLQSVVWLESFLLSYEGSILLISHDRKFLNTLTTRIFNWIAELSQFMSVTMITMKG